MQEAIFPNSKNQGFFGRWALAASFTTTCIAGMSLLSAVASWASAGMLTHKVSGVAAGDVLKIRKSPNAKSKVVATLKNGDLVLVYIFYCTNSKTGKPVKPENLKRGMPHLWCNVGTPDGNVEGYANYKFLEVVKEEN